MEKLREPLETFVDRVPLSQKIVAQILEIIGRNHLKAGDRLPTERELALQLGVSRTAVRDAVKLLAGQGLLRVAHGSGIYIANQDRVTEQIAALLTIRRGSLQELFEVRKLIEVESAGWAAERGQAEALSKIKKIVEQAGSALEDTPSLARLDAEFHLAVVEAGGNKVLLQIMLNLLDLLADGRRESLGIPGRPVRSVGEHHELTEAILQRDGPAARHLMWQHLDSVEKSIMAGLEMPGKA